MRGLTLAAVVGGAGGGEAVGRRGEGGGLAEQSSEYQIWGSARCAESRSQMGFSKPRDERDSTSLFRGERVKTG